MRNLKENEYSFIYGGGQDRGNSGVSKETIGGAIGGAIGGTYGGIPGAAIGTIMGASIANGSRGTGSVGPSGIPWGGSNGGGVMWGSSSSSSANGGS
ncbi:hypothetical protein D3R80_22180 [Salmonella enterica]|nr:hypothetical protein [Salmonella enterica]EBP3305937.1 hypothetical protein [Salmonella enterica subsp. enterica]EBZ6049772.1 hypothetical protein [Salmonella enterica subsp. enterica serovar Texas]ECM4035951.1 hypothetical protein [Salmonella enterica subsp. enterica serovar Montevideo]EDC9713711.1 hypothetical protein [Salmonella enterica subsp. enterica serovar Muenchen]EDX7803003.1 hypothetical protein [Salmonella enterica subsp. enterica serovar Oranienburg]